MQFIKANGVASACKPFDDNDYYVYLKMKSFSLPPPPKLRSRFKAIHFKRIL